MSCQEYLANLSLITAQYTAQQNTTEEPDSVFLVKYLLYKIGLPILCVFGIVGNGLNVIILTRKQLQQAMDRMEKSVHLGLVALAIADFCFCIVALPMAFSPNAVLYTEQDSLAFLYYLAYQEPFINFFLLSSTWLTVAMATGRYMAICYPIHARSCVNLKATRLTILGIFLVSIIFNMPQFWRYSIPENYCAAECRCYMLQITSLYKNHFFVISYKILWAIFGVFVPLFILAFCNFCLIRALRESRRMRQLYRANKTKDSGHQLTPTLIAIVAMFIILVSPSEILKFLETWVISRADFRQYQAFMISQFVANFFQVINFSINFVLYCALNVHFRKTVRSLVCGLCHQQKYKYTPTSTLMVNISDCPDATEM